jgi:Flp pilus assembly protein CpaB
MSRRGRAIAFVALALLAAVAGAVVLAGYGSSVTRGYGPLRRVVVVSAGLPAGQSIGPEEVAQRLAVRRVPERFVPVGALAVPGDALGRVPRAPAPAGSYLLAAQLRAPRRRSRPRLGRRRSPVEIAVSGADALLSLGHDGSRRVDVVVTSEPDGPGPGRTYVAAAAVPLLALRPGADGPGPGGTSAATLGLTRSQALRLISAESFARKVTVVPVG